MNLGAPGNAGKEQGCFLLENCWGSRALHLPAASNTALRIGSTRGPGGFLGEQSSGTNPVLSDLSPGSRDSFPEFSSNPLFTSWLIFGVSQSFSGLWQPLSAALLCSSLYILAGEASKGRSFGRNEVGVLCHRLSPLPPAPALNQPKPAGKCRK